MDSPLEMLRRDGEGSQGLSVLMGDLVRRMGVVLGVVAEEPLGGAWVLSCGGIRRYQGTGVEGDGGD